MPIGLVVLLVAARVMPATRSARPPGIDLPGTVGFAATLTALLVRLTEGHALRWPWWSWLLLPLAVPLAPLALVGAGQSMLFTGFFRSVLTDVPVQLGGIGSGVLITVQQSGLALGVATLGTLFLTLAPHSYRHAFATVKYVQIGIVALLAVGAAALPRFTQASADVPVIDG